MISTIDHISKDELLNMLVSNTPVGYIVLDRTYKIHYINEHFMKMRNLTKENTLGRHCYDLSNGGVKCAVCAVASAISTRTHQKVMRKDLLPNGELRYIEDYAFPLYKDDKMSFDFLLEIMINRTSEMLYKENLDKDFINLIHALVSLLEAKDKYTAAHSKNVGQLSLMLAKTMDLSEEHVFNIDVAAQLHDIGKVNIPYSIINKPGKLTDEEYRIIKEHPGNSYVILQRLSGFPKVKEYVRHHHERFDGKGYPDGIGGNEIPLGARIISIADTYEAMTSTRSYRGALSHETAIAEIKANAGTQFDPRLVEYFVNMNFDVEKGASTQMKKRSNLIERELFNKVDTEVHEPIAETPFSQILSDERFIEEIFVNTPVSYVLLTPEHDIMYASPFFLQTFHLTMNDIKGKKCYDASGAGSKCPNCPMERAVLTKQLVQEELIQTINGQIRFFDCFAMPYMDKDGKLIYILEMLIDRTEERVLQMEHEHDLYNMISMITDIIAANDQMAFIKSKFIRELCNMFTNVLDISKEEEQQIDIAATICDIGMISMRDTAVNDPEILKTHPQVAFDILGKLSVFKNVKRIIKYHHELYNGEGYPEGLIGEEIPLGSRIIALACAYFDYSTEGSEIAIEKIRQNRGKQFDPQLVAVFLEHAQEWLGL